MNTWLVLAVLAAGVCGSYQQEARQPAHRPDPPEVLEHESARKIDSGSSQVYKAILPGSKFVTSKYGRYPSKHQYSVRQSVVYDGHHDNAIDIDNKPTKKIIKRKELSLGRIFRHLFDIVKESLAIMMQIQSEAIERADGNEVESKFDAWKFTKRLFHRYLVIINENEILSDVRDFIPVERLEVALERETPDELVQVMISSFTPKLLNFFFGLIRDIVGPFFSMDSFSSAELREHVPSIDITYPIRYIVHRILGIVGHVFSRRELSRYWSEFRAYTPFTARSLEYAFPVDEDFDTPSTALEESVKAEDTTSFRSYVTDPYMVMAGLGATIVATYLTYAALDSAAAEHQARHRREAGLLDVDDISSAVEAAGYNKYDLKTDDSQLAAVLKARKTKGKKYNKYRDSLSKDSVPALPQ